MKLRISLATISLLLLSVLSSEARRGGGDSGGGLARERGLSQAETDAAGQVVSAAASGASATSDSPAAPTRRLSPDYYRVFHPGAPVAGAKKVAAAKATPAPTPLAPVATPKPKVIAAVVAPLPKAKPTPPPAKPAPAPKRVLVAATKPSAKPTPVAAKLPAQRVPIRVAVMPQDSNGTIYLAPNRKGNARAAAQKLPPAKPAAPAVKAKRTLFL